MGFAFSNVTKYRGPYVAREKVNPAPPLPDGVIAAYEDVEHDSSWFTDWVVSWQTTYLESPSLQFTLEVNNVFNEKMQVADNEEYRLGRQFWAGVSYRF